MKKVFDDAWAPYGHVAPYGGRKLVGGGKADGPMGPPGYSDPDDKKID
jgi:hypothetical protein